MINLKAIGRFGRKVLGKERAEAEKEMRKVAANRFGKKVTGVDPAAKLANIKASPAPSEPPPSGEPTDTTAPPEQDDGDQSAQQLHPRFTVSADSPPLDTGDDEEEDGEEQTGGEGESGDSAGVPDLAKLSINKLAAILQGNPLLLDGALEAELGREGGPRKGALVAMFTVEEGRPTPRQAVLDRLKDEIAKLG